MGQNQYLNDVDAERDIELVADEIGYRVQALRVEYVQGDLIPRVRLKLMAPVEYVHMTIHLEDEDG